MRDDRGQALLLLVGALAAVLVGAFVLGAVARGVGMQGRDQRAADLAALADIHEQDDLDEDQLVSWVRQASNLPGEKM